MGGSRTSSVSSSISSISSIPALSPLVAVVVPGPTRVSGRISIAVHNELRNLCSVILLSGDKQTKRNTLRIQGVDK
ncbi:hypothetical protein BDV23DRAFT_161230 [Aspergillus alliaceus]|uniref:Uncharacterized protein n=1 Tax=Petromyces alliaceus TaxID=209559 RepID=A0A5N7C0T4_PETAA|nr:hypothetical protein BDV23DRAFT_161230 [Aspergillus alliaceus]